MRSVMSFRCADEWLVGVMDRTSDAQRSNTGLLIISGGNEIAIGPQRAMARLAQSIRQAGFPVFRFDRRGIGDSGGENRGYRSSRDDIRAAIDCFAHHGAYRIVAFGICDAATALVLHDLPVAARVLGNPWLGEGDSGLPPAPAIRRRYRQRLTDPAAWRALFHRDIDLAKLLRGLRAVATSGGAAPPLAAEMAERLRATAIPTTIVLTQGDATGIGFAAAWRHTRFDPIRDAVAVRTIPGDTHGFTGDDELRALADLLCETLIEADRA